MTRAPVKQAAKPGKQASKPRRGINGAAKGAAFERLMAKQLSLWVSAGESEDLLWRSGGSGARSTSRVKRGGKALNYQSADIALVDPAAQPFADLFVAECKFYKQLDLHRMFYDPKASVIGAWWAKVCKEADEVSKEPMLVVKGNTYKALVFMRPWRPPAGLGVLVHDLNATALLFEELVTYSFRGIAHPPSPPRKGVPRARLLLSP